MTHEENAMFWTYSVGGGELFDAEFNTQEEAQADADERYAEQIADEESPRNGETFSNDIELIRFTWDDETGERVIHERVPGTVEYEHYHGDLKEHGTWG